MIERINRDTKGNNEKPAARSKADAAEPLGVSLYLSRGGNGFFVYCSFALTLFSALALRLILFGYFPTLRTTFVIAIFFRVISRLFGSLRLLLSIVDYFYIVIYFVRFSGVLRVICTSPKTNVYLSAFRDRLRLTLIFPSDILSDTIDFCLFGFAAANGNCQGAAFISRKA